MVFTPLLTGELLGTPFLLYSKGKWLRASRIRSSLLSVALSHWNAFPSAPFQRSLVQAQAASLLSSRERKREWNFRAFEIIAVKRESIAAYSAALIPAADSIAAVTDAIAKRAFESSL